MNGPMTPSDNNKPSPYQLESAQLEWRDDIVPTSSNYDDIYFSKQHGLDETHYVFLHHNQLAERWQQLDKNNPGIFTIAETGFGTGLNFLATWQLWQLHAPKNWQLYFISVEKHPLKKADLQKALSAWPQLSNLSQTLISQYPPLIPGHHVIHFESVKLHLLLTDASEGFEQCLSTHHPAFSPHYGAKVDAWFLDGFAPAKNPSMWSERLFELIRDLSKKNTTVATFTAAGIVKRGLQQAGFTTKKVKGFGHKREMLTAVYEHAAQEPVSNKRHKAPWALYPPPKTVRQGKAKHVAVIGGGIAGCTTAYALANSGIQVTLIERHRKLAQEASGNAQGMLYTKLSTQAGTLSQFGLSCYFFATRYYQALQQQQILTNNEASFCGLLQLCLNKKQQNWLADLSQIFQGQDDWLQFLNTEQSQQVSGISTSYPGYFLSQSGWVSPSALCDKLSLHHNIDIITEQQAIELQYVEPPQTEAQESHRWAIVNSKQQSILHCDAIVIANSHDATQFQQTNHLPLKVIRGQITELTQTCFNELPQTVICHEGYITPAIDGQVRFGATFDLGDREKNIRPGDHLRNITSLQQALPTTLIQASENIQGRANLRCTTPDYMPIVGQVGMRREMIADFLPLNKDANRVINKPGSYYPGLYINVAHGAKGLTSAPLCAELLTALINQHPSPMPRDLVDALNPARFIIRDIIRGKIVSAC
ncbi:MAG: tRNA 5-methylaminomethyl-2-thiouridine biosynthesis bifunctional protein [Pseudohongiellaceae bacterium]|jgi:tRNA 5-methylaminomethyl-2-thiouridine biosynthesis bifunctional protein